MSSLITNRDLYLFVAQLCETRKAQPRSLEDYLRALWHLGSEHSHQPALSLSCFASLLERAFEAPLPPFDPAWAQAYETTPEGRTGFAHWRSVIHRQIVDLREMQQAGILDDDQRCFGVDAPRGLRWYNFDPLAFLECGVAGTFDGWQDGDPTDRCYVPGPVAVIGEDGTLTTMAPEDIEAPIEAIGPISWDVFASFLCSGQWYE